MKVSFRCDGCGKTYTTDAAMAGKRAKCKACGAVTTVPAAVAPKPRQVVDLEDEEGGIYDVAGPDPEEVTAPAPVPAEPTARTRGGKNWKKQLLSVGEGAVLVSPAVLLVLFLMRDIAPRMPVVASITLIGYGFVATQMGTPAIRAVIAREEPSIRRRIKSEAFFVLHWMRANRHVEVIRRVHRLNRAGSIIATVGIVWLIYALTRK